uniref:Syntaxin/t-SNARE family protein n=1 Tax=Tanacetum cinerariifolium TaxID=118510 RepID=A0A6L2LIW3_TANCI|nr:syntaxin/t-SNARE family protein [Tanacetum cinerariifolium]
MESTYRTLIHASKEPSVWKSEALQRDLRTSLGTTKWQLEEFERAVVLSYDKNSTDDMKDRHRDFISAMESQISRVESSWNDSSVSTGKPPRPWVRLDEGERRELALFLSGSTTPGDEQPAKTRSSDEQRGRRKNKVEAKEDKFLGHRRAASTSDIRAWNITVDNDNVSPHEKIEKPSRKMPSFSGLLNTLEYASKLKWPKNGYTKLSQEADDRSSETRPLTRGVKEIHVMSTRPEHCDDHYNKRLHGWYGAIQRQLQRSQNYMLYSRRTQVILSVLVIICLLALVVFRLI